MQPYDLIVIGSAPAGRGVEVIHEVAGAISPTRHAVAVSKWNALYKGTQIPG
jgi:hypothetical protein